MKRLSVELCSPTAFLQLMGLEPTPKYMDMNLNHARMPIPPQLQASLILPSLGVKVNTFLPFELSREVRLQILDLHALLLHGVAIANRDAAVIFRIVTTEYCVTHFYLNHFLYANTDSSKVTVQ